MKAPRPQSPERQEVAGRDLQLVQQGADHIPAVCFIVDVCRILQTSRRTVERLRRHGCFPIPELPALDKRPRWSAHAIQAFLHGDQSALRKLRKAG